MSQPDPYSRERYVSTAIILGWAALLLICGTMPDARLWGLNHLAFLPSVARWGLPGLALLAVAGVWFISATTEWRSSAHGLGIAWCAGFIAMAVFARSATQLLGDGYLRADEAARRLPEFFVTTDLLPAWITATLHQRTFLGRMLSGQETVAFLSIASGVLLLVGLWWLWPKVTGEGEGHDRASLVWLLTAGSAQLYFGYVELYPLPAMLLTLFILSILAFRQAHVSWLWPLLFWIGAFWSHLASIAWAPLLVWTVISQSDRARRVLRGSVAVIVITLSVVTLRALQSGPTGSLERYLLPLWADGYSVIDWRHLADIVNLILLLFPVGMLLLLYEPKSGRLLDRWTALFVVGPTVLFLCFLRVDLGYPRDWDLLALVCTPPLVLLALTMAREVHRACWPRVVAALFVAVSGLGLWVMTNAREASSVERFTHLVRLDSYAATSGYEVLARYHREKMEWGRAAEILGQALLDEPTARMAVQQGISWSQVGRYDSALIAFETAVSLDSGYADGQFGVGQSLWALGHVRESLPFLSRAVSMDSTRADYRYHLGMSLWDLGRLADALPQLSAAARLGQHQPGFAHAWAMAVSDSGDTSRAVGILDSLRTSFPSYAPAYIDAIRLLAAREDSAGAKRLLEEYKGHVPPDQWPSVMTQLADSLKFDSGSRSQ